MERVFGVTVCGLVLLDLVFSELNMEIDRSNTFTDESSFVPGSVIVSFLLHPSFLLMIVFGQMYCMHLNCH